MRKLACAVCSFAAAVVWSPSTRAGEESGPLTIERAVALALDNHPGLAVLRIDRGAARARSDDASRWIRDNPTLAGQVGPRLMPGRTTIDVGASLEQPFELAGQRGARVGARAADERAAEAEVEAGERALAAEVRTAFTHALAAEAMLVIAKETEALAESAVSATVERQRLGDATRIEVNAARIELGRAIRERLALERDRLEALSRLATSIGVPDPELRLAGQLQPAPPRELGIDEALAIAKSERPELRRAHAEVEAAEAEATLAAREAVPDLAVGVAYGREEEANIVQGTLALELPVFDRNQEQRGASEAGVVRARRNREGAELSIEHEVRLALFRYSIARRGADTYAQDELTAIAENLQLATEAYRAGKFDFLELMLVRREAIAAQRGYVEAIETLNAADADLSRALGRMP